MRELYNQPRVYLVKRLNEMGIKIATNLHGAFYVFCDLSSYNKNSYEFCIEALNNAKVALIPAIDLGTNDEGYIRFSYATSLEDIVEGMNRLEKYFKTF